MIDRRRQCGLTLIELIMSMFSLGVLGLAVAVLMAATGSAWETRDDYRMQIDDARCFLGHVSQWVRCGKRVMWVAANGDHSRVDVMLWVEDDVFPGAVNLSELRLLSYDADTSEVTLYAAALSIADQGSAVKNPGFDAADAGDTSFAVEFKNRSDVEGYVVASGVSGFGAVGRANDTGCKYTSLELRMKFDGEGGEQMEVISASARAPDESVAFGN